MASGIYLTRASGVFRLWGTTKPKGRGPRLKEAWPDHPIRSSIIITKLLLGGDILKKNNNNKWRNEIF